MGIMKVIGNIIWIIFGGLETALVYFTGGVLLSLTIIGIPFGVQLFKIGAYSFLPFGYIHQYKPSSGCLSLVMNLIWIVTFGIIIALMHFTCGLFLCLTIIGIPFGLQHFKLMALAFAPFGAEIIRD